MKTLKDYIVNENNFFKNLGVGQETLIRKWLDEHGVKEYTINSDMTIDVEVSVSLNNIKEDELPEYIQFGDISYNFGIIDSNIKSLRGFPKRCNDMGIKNCPNLKNLNGLGTIQHQLSLTNCSKLISLKGGGQCTYGSLRVHNCPITDLTGTPEKLNSIVLQNCSKLTSLKGGPNKSCGQYYIYCCESLESLEYVPEVVGDFRCMDCPKITSLEGLKKVIGELVAVGCGKTFTNKYLEKLNIEQGGRFYFYNKRKKNGNVYNG